MTARAGSIGRTDFVERFGLWTTDQSDRAERVLGLMREHDVELVRFSFADQHGILRGKSIVADAVGQAMKNGVAITTTLLVKDTSHRTIYPVWQPGGGLGMPEMVGASDVLMVPDPATFRVLPWAPGTGWMLCDIYFPTGEPVPFSTRHILRGVLDRLADKGYGYLSGFECEFYVFRMEDPKLQPEHATQPATAPEVSLLAHGFNYVTEVRQDELEPALALLRRTLLDLDLPLRSIEAEFGPGQCEFTFHPGLGLETPDMVMLFRSAVKQVCRRHGYHATFMCQPALENVFASGWHLHQSLIEETTGANAFAPKTEDETLSPLGRNYLAGLLEHAAPAAAFTTPTINGYKRYKPHSLAPERIVWGIDNKGAMLRALGRKDDPGTRIENRAGDPSANPYLYLASQILSGLDGVERAIEPPPPTETPYDATAPALPKSLMEAVAVLKQDAFFRGALGDGFVDYFVSLKEAEIARFLSEVTDWEQREYFEMF